MPAGAIISQDPSAGTSVAQGSTISVVVSLGPPLVEVPNVVDMPVDEAIAELDRGRVRLPRSTNPVRGQPAQPRRVAGPRGRHAWPPRAASSARHRSDGDRSEAAPLADRRARPDQRRPGQARRRRTPTRSAPSACRSSSPTRAAGRLPRATRCRTPRSASGHAARLPAYVHASFLINLGTPDAAIAEKSAISLAHTIERARAIGARGVVVHTGSAVGKDRYDEAMTQTRRAAASDPRRAARRRSPGAARTDRRPGAVALLHARRARRVPAPARAPSRASASASTPATSSPPVTTSLPTVA